MTQSVVTKACRVCLIRVNDVNFDHVSIQSAIRRRNSGLWSPFTAVFPSWFGELKRCLALQIANIYEKMKRY